MSEPTVLQKKLEEYVIREHLYEVIPEHRRPLVKPPAAYGNPLLWACIWPTLLWLLEIYLVFRHAGYGGLVFTVLAPLALFVLVPSSIVAVFLLVISRGGPSFRVNLLPFVLALVRPEGFVEYRQRALNFRRITLPVLILGCPLLLAVATGLYLWLWAEVGWYTSLLDAVWYAALSVVGSAIMLFIADNLSLINSMLKMMKRILPPLVTLAPLLLVIVLFPVFSAEFWQALGTLPLFPDLLIIVLLLSLPAVVFVLVFLGRVADEIISKMGELPEPDEIIKETKGIPSVKQGIDERLIDDQHWQNAYINLEWRDQNKLTEDLRQILCKRAKRWLGLWLLLTSLVLVVVFLVYFFVLFLILLKPSNIAVWVVGEEGTQFSMPGVLAAPFNYLASFWVSDLGQAATASIATFKVSLLLSVFVAAMSNVYALTQDPMKAMTTQWLEQRTPAWRAASCIYQSIMSPNYQVWEYVAHDKKRGIANVSIVFRQGIPEDHIKVACTEMLFRLKMIPRFRVFRAFRNLILVTAFKKGSNQDEYKYGGYAECWQLLDHYRPLHLPTQEEHEVVPHTRDVLYSQHSLGKDSLQSGAEVPDGWFGNTQGAPVARSVWEAEFGNRDLVLHPYAFQNGTTLSLIVRLERTMNTSTEYREMVSVLLDLVRGQVPDSRTISIYLVGDTSNELAYLLYGERLSHIVYRDDKISRAKFEKRQAWGLPERVS